MLPKQQQRLLRTRDLLGQVQRAPDGFPNTSKQPLRLRICCRQPLDNSRQKKSVMGSLSWFALATPSRNGNRFKISIETSKQQSRSSFKTLRIQMLMFVK